MRRVTSANDGSGSLGGSLGSNAVWGTEASHNQTGANMQGLSAGSGQLMSYGSGMGLVGVSGQPGATVGSVHIGSGAIAVVNDAGSSLASTSSMPTFDKSNGGGSLAAAASMPTFDKPVYGSASGQNATWETTTGGVAPGGVSRWPSSVGPNSASTGQDLSSLFTRQATVSNASLTALGAAPNGIGSASLGTTSAGQLGGSMFRPQTTKPTSTAAPPGFGGSLGSLHRSPSAPASGLDDNGLAQPTSQQTEDSVFPLFSRSSASNLPGMRNTSSSLGGGRISSLASSSAPALDKMMTRSSVGGGAAAGGLKRSNHLLRRPEPRETTEHAAGNASGVGVDAGNNANSDFLLSLGLRRPASTGVMHGSNTGRRVASVGGTLGSIGTLGGTNAGLGGNAGLTGNSQNASFSNLQQTMSTGASGLLGHSTASIGAATPGASTLNSTFQFDKNTGGVSAHGEDGGYSHLSFLNDVIGQNDEKGLGNEVSSGSQGLPHGMDQQRSSPANDGGASVGGGSAGAASPSALLNGNAPPTASPGSKSLMELIHESSSSGGAENETGGSGIHGSPRAENTDSQHQPNILASPGQTAVYGSNGQQLQYAQIQASPAAPHLTSFAPQGGQFHVDARTGIVQTTTPSQHPGATVVSAPPNADGTQGGLPVSHPLAGGGQAPSLHHPVTVAHQGAPAGTTTMLIDQNGNPVVASAAPTAAGHASAGSGATVAYHAVPSYHIIYANPTGAAGGAGAAGQPATVVLQSAPPGAGGVGQAAGTQQHPHAVFATPHGHNIITIAPTASGAPAAAAGPAGYWQQVSSGATTEAFGVNQHHVVQTTAGAGGATTHPQYINVVNPHLAQQNHVPIVAASVGGSGLGGASIGSGKGGHHSPTPSGHGGLRKDPGMPGVGGKGYQTRRGGGAGVGSSPGQTKSGKGRRGRDGSGGGRNAKGLGHNMLQTHSPEGRGMVGAGLGGGYVEGGVRGGSPSYSSVLEEFKMSRNAKNGSSGGSLGGRSWTVVDIRGHIVEFCQDQNGSRFLQSRLDLCSADGLSNMDEGEMVLDELLCGDNFAHVKNDVFGNYVVQKLLERGTSEMRGKIKEKVRGEMVTLSLQMYGCRVIQKVLETLGEDHLLPLLSEFHGHVLELIRDQNGNHVCQKIIEVLSIKAKQQPYTAEDGNEFSRAVEFIVSDVLANVEHLSCHPYGCRVLQRMLEHCVPSQKERTLRAIGLCHEVLLDDQYGNYVIQHVLQFGTDEDRESILKLVLREDNGVLKLSRQKFASNVVEKLLQYGSTRQRNLLVGEMLKVVSESDGQIGDCGSAVVLLMVRDPFANYVVQTTLNVLTEGEERRRLLEVLNANSEQLRNYTFAKHIVSKLCA